MSDAGIATQPAREATARSCPLVYPCPVPPTPGSALELAPGLRWIRMPLPFALDHIDLWHAGRLVRYVGADGAIRFEHPGRCG